MYILQKGEDRANGDGYKPQVIKELPKDIINLTKGDWIYSYLLNGFVGYELSQQENYNLYWNRVLGKISV